MDRELVEQKFSYVSIKTTRAPAKAGSTCFILNDFDILMLYFAKKKKDCDVRVSKITN